MFQALLLQILIDVAGILGRGFDILSLIRQTVFEKSIEILCFASNGGHTKLVVLVHSGANLPSEKPKILLTTKISAKTIFRI